MNREIMLDLYEQASRETNHTMNFEVTLTEFLAKVFEKLASEPNLQESKLALQLEADYLRAEK